MHAYCANLVRHLRQDDAERTIMSVACLETQLNENRFIFNHILWTDESMFTNNGDLNKQNIRFWNDQNRRHWTFEINRLPDFQLPRPRRSIHHLLLALGAIQGGGGTKNVRDRPTKTGPHPRPVPTHNKDGHTGMRPASCLGGHPRPNSEL